MGVILAILIALSGGHHHHRHHHHHHHHNRAGIMPVHIPPAPMVRSEVGSEPTPGTESEEITEEWPERPATPQEIEEIDHELEGVNEWP